MFLKIDLFACLLLLTSASKPTKSRNPFLLRFHLSSCYFNKAQTFVGAELSLLYLAPHRIIHIFHGPKSNGTLKWR